MNRKTKKRFIDVLGWLGAACVLLAYFLVSFGVVHPRDMSYQMLNLIGSIGLGTVCYFNRTYQPLFVNVIWGLIALLAVLNIFLAR